MVFELPISIEDLDFLRMAVGFFVLLILFGILQKSKILGKNKGVNLVISAIVGFLAMSNDSVVGFIIGFSSNIAVLAIIGLVVVLVLFFANVSAFAMFMVSLIVVLILIKAEIYPFYFVLNFLPENVIAYLITGSVLITVILLLLGKKKE